MIFVLPSLAFNSPRPLLPRTWDLLTLIPKIARDKGDPTAVCK